MKISDSFYKKWYDDLNLQYHFLTFFKNRECLVMSKRLGYIHRLIRIHSAQHFQHWINILSNYIDGVHPYRNFYYSMMKYDGGIPKVAGRLINRQDVIPKDWINTHFNTAVSYDFLIDIDAHDNNHLEMAKSQTMKLHLQLKFYEVEHEVRFTGNGFHIIIPSHALNHDYDLKTEFGELSEFLMLIHKQLKKKYSLLDVGMGSDARRVVKVPFSLSVYGDLSVHVCVPFQSTEQLHFFNIECADPVIWISKRKNSDRYFQEYYKHCVFCKGGTINKFLEEVKKW